MGKDLRHALRQLTRSPGFTFVVVVTLALGIGATTAIFTLVDAVLLRPLDYPDPGRIVTLWSLSLRSGNRYQVSGLDFRDWQQASRSFSDMAKYAGEESAVVVGNVAERVGVSLVSGSLFRVLGKSPRAGRLFSDEELRTGGAAVVSDGFARRHFAADPTRVIGASLQARGRTFRVIGVMPPGFGFPGHSDVWLPVDPVAPWAEARTAHNYRVIGRLRADTSLSQAQAEMDGIAAGLALQYPKDNGNKGARLVPLQELLVGDYQSTLWILLGAVTLVLLIACANIANLLLARGARRSHEMAVRAALGASRGRIARQLLGESLVLAALGGVAGLLAAYWALDVLLALAPAGIPRLEHVAIDRRTLLFTGAVALVVSLLIGLFPAIQAARGDLTSALHAGGRNPSATRGRLRGSLVVAQLAISLVLLTGAGLLLRSLTRLSSVDPGYRLEKLLVMEADHSAAADPEGQQALNFFQELRRRAAAWPGVTALSYTASLPIDSVGSDGSYDVEGLPILPFSSSATQHANFRLVGPDYFSTLGVDSRAGRQLDGRDVAGAAKTVVINEAMARATWPGQSPLGRRIRCGWYSGTQEWMTIVGIVADTRQSKLDAPIGQELYIPAAQHPRLTRGLKIVARTALDPLALAEGFRRTAQAIDPQVPVRFTTAELMVGQTLAAPRFRALLIGLFAAVALLLAVVGVAGVMAYLVAERRMEIGIRMAIGATPAGILRQFLLRGLGLALVGLALGLVGAVASARLLQGLLFGISATDPRTIAVVSAILVIAALAATAWPALQASRQSPMVALRAD